MSLRKIKAAFALVFLSGMLMACSKENPNVDLGMSAIQDNHYEEALENFDQAVMAGEDPQLINRGRGIAYIGMSNYEEAIECLTVSLQNSDGHISDLEYDTNYYLALAYYKNHDYDNAIETYSAIIAMNDDQIEAYFNRGLSYLAIQKLELATSDFDKAIALDKKDYSKYIDIFCSLDYLGYTDIGVTYLQKALSVNDRKQTDFDKGRLYFYLGDYKEALNYFNLATRSTGGDAYLYLGKCHEALGDYNYAASVYLGYLENEKNAEIYNQLGLCKMKMGFYQEALEAFQSGILMEEPGMMQSLKLNEITACEYLGDFDQAKMKMASYLSEFPNDLNAYREYGFLETR